MDLLIELLARFISKVTGHALITAPINEWGFVNWAIVASLIIVVSYTTHAALVSKRKPAQQNKRKRRRKN